MERVLWLDQDRGIILWRFDDNPTLETLLSDFEGYRSLVTASGRSTLHTLVDLSTVHDLPHDIVKRFPSIAKELHPPDDLTGSIAIVHNGLFMHSILDMYSRSSGYQFAYFHSFDAAYRYVQEQSEQASSSNSG